MKKSVKRVIGNTLAQLISRGVGVVLSLVTTSFLTRFLGPSQWGNYVFLTSFTLVLVAVSDWGSQLIGVRELSRTRKKKKKRNVFWTLFFLRFFLAAGVFLLGGGVVIFTPWFKGLFWPAFWALMVVFLLSFDTSFEMVFQSFLKMERKAFLDLIYSFSFFFLSLFFLLRGMGLTGVILAWFWARFLAVVVGGYLSLSLLGRGGVFQRKLAGYLWRESLPMGTLLILFTLYDRGVDTLFLKVFTSEEVVGFYGLAYKIYSNLVLPAYFLANSLFPFFSRREKRFSFFFSWGIKWAFLGGGVILLGAWWLAPWGVRLLGGEGFLATVFLFRLLLLALPFAWLNHILGFFLISRHQQRISLRIGAAALIWNLVLNWVFIPRWGAPAAAGITVATEILVFIAYLFFFYRRGFFLKQV